MLQKTDLDRLVTYESYPAITILMPMHMGGRDVRQDAIRLRKLVQQVRGRLVQDGMRTADADSLLDATRTLFGDEGILREQAAGLALFLAHGLLETHKLPFAVPEETIVGQRFHVRHILPYFDEDGPFLVLAVTSGHGRLYQATRHTMTERKDIVLPGGTGAVAAETDIEMTREARPSTRISGGAGIGAMPADTFGADAEQLRKTGLVTFLTRLGNAIEKATGKDRLPIVLAAGNEIAGHFRAHSQLPNLIDETIDENPERMAESELHARAYAIMAPRFRTTLTRDIDRFHALFGEGNPKASVTPENIIQAAPFGRIETLFVADESHVWGKIDGQSGEPVAHAEPQAGDEDLLDFATLQTLRNGGHAHVLPLQDNPFARPLAAIFRY